MADSIKAHKPRMRLALIGTLGAVLVLVVLAASMMLRLTTAALSGHALSLLPDQVENIVRVTHRLAASGSALLAVVAAILCWRGRPLGRGYIAACTIILTLTVLLTLLGVISANNRAVAVVTGNVAGGTLLLTAFWWLRVAARTISQRLFDGFALAALIAVLAQVTLGAALSAAPRDALIFIAHATVALLAAMLGLAAAFAQRHNEKLQGMALAVFVLIAAQAALGIYLSVDRHTALAWLHGMLAPLLAAGLLSLAVRGAGESKIA
jgi:heme A synthase